MDSKWSAAVEGLVSSESWELGELLGCLTKRKYNEQL